MENKPVKIGIVSPGRWGALLIDSIKGSESLELAGVASRSLDRSREFADQFGGRSFPDFDSMLRSDCIEAVLLPTPHFLHGPQARRALEYGKHVFIEKPIANSIHEALTLENISRERGLVVGVGQQLRRTGAARKAKSLIDSGEIGTVALARAAIGAPLLGQYSKGDWELDPRLIPGGALDNLAIHYVDLLRYFLGEALRVGGLTSNCSSERNVVTVATATIQFENGVLSSLTTHQISPYVSELSIYGTKGVIHFKRAGQELWRELIVNTEQAKKSKPKLEPVEFDGPLPHSTALREELEDFAKCIRRGSQPEVGSEEGIAALRVIRAIMESSDSGKFVEITPFAC